jgi:nucleotide-binding universal stress UspA family protein
MSYKTILVHIDDSPQSSARVAAGLLLARRFDAHLIGAAPTGVSRFLYQLMPSADADPTLALHLDFVRERAQQAVAAFHAQVQAETPLSCEARLLDDEAGEGMALHARGADLVLVGQADPHHAHVNLPADFAAHVVLHAGRPVLVLPHGTPPATIATRVLLSWDGGKEAARALAMALPLLEQASEVQIAVFDTGGSSRATADALAADPVTWLARHGVAATLTVHKVETRRTPHRRHAVGDALLALAEASGTDLLVMGAYGHSRLRETILGGVTRTVFEEMTMPVLMAH